jgi:SulP family sulfate permease
MRFVSRSVVTGFVNALAILIFMAQLPELIDVTWHVYAMTAAGLAIIYGCPTDPAVPSPLVTIVVLSARDGAGPRHPHGRRHGRAAGQPAGVPAAGRAAEPGDAADHLAVSLTLMVVGLLESMMTATIVDDLTDYQERQEPRVRGPGRGQHRQRLHRRHGRLRDDRPVGDQREIRRARAAVDLRAGVFLLLMVVFLGDWVGADPMAALVAVMIMVSIGTFNWASLREPAHASQELSVVMLATVAVTVATHDLAQGRAWHGRAAVGLLLRAQGRQMLLRALQVEDDGRTRTYRSSARCSSPAPIASSRL